MEEQSRTNNISIPIAIVIAGALIAGAVYFGQRGDAGGVTTQAEAERENAQLSASLESMAPITSKDHVRGKPERLG